VSLFGRSLPPAIYAIAVLLFAPAALSADGPHAVQVTSNSVTVRDLLLPAMPTDGVGEDILGRDVLSGLRPGEQRILAPAEIHLRLSEIGIDAAARGWFWPHALIITRLSQVISAADLIAAGEQAIRPQLDLHPGDAASITPVTKPRPLLAPLGDITLEALVRPPRLPGGLWIADITGRQSGGAAVLDCTIRYRVRITGPVLVARRALRRGDALTEESVLQQTRDLTNLRGQPLRTTDQLTGLRVSRAASPGTILTTDWIEPIPAVRRGQLITALARVGAVRASARVRALADAGLGDTVRVRTDEDRAEFLARVAGPGLVEVTVLP